MSATTQTDYCLLRPAPREGVEVWAFSGKDSEAILREGGTIPKRGEDGIVALESRFFLCLPLWVAADADAAEVVSLEFASRYLARKGQSSYALIVERTVARSLVLGILPSDNADLDTRWLSAKRFDFPANLISPGQADAAIWYEAGHLCFGFYRKGRCADFIATNEVSVNEEFAAQMTRHALRLLAEGIIEQCATICVIGDFSEDEKSILAKNLEVQIEQIPICAPTSIDSSVEVAPPAAIAWRTSSKARRRFWTISLAAAALYAVLLAAFGISYTMKTRDVSAATREAAALQNDGLAAKQSVERWKILHPAVDTQAFALDQLAAAAQAIPADNVRLTQFVCGRGRVLISGEASDVGQTYTMFDSIKKSPAMAAYEWTARQPAIAGRIVRFEFEGRTSNAANDTE